MDISSTLSNTGSKQTVLEESSITFASLEEAKKRENDAISNERIKKGDLILDTYEVTSDAISGGMGSVWRVHHQSWNTDLAMKRPQPKFFAEGSGKRKEQFVAECENWINLGLHPNIVSCYYVREIGGVPSIFSEWMDNGSLKDRIVDGSLYEGTEADVQKRILDIAIQAARGLQYSHENGLIHQDMKPGNLLLSKDWDAKVADFGLAKAKEQLDDPSDTAKTTGYTLAYCPKEQSEGEAPEKWMDVYAWALTVLEMYAGKRLWEKGCDVPQHYDTYRIDRSIPKDLRELLKICLINRIGKSGKVVKRLLRIYHKTFGHDYPRSASDAASDTAASLNNRALSFLDLNQTERALALWEKAIKQDNSYFLCHYNLAVALWENNRIGADELYRRIEAQKENSDAWKRAISDVEFTVPHPQNLSYLNTESPEIRAILLRSEPLLKEPFYDFDRELFVEKTQPDESIDHTRTIRLTEEDRYVLCDKSRDNREYTFQTYHQHRKDDWTVRARFADVSGSIIVAMYHSLDFYNAETGRSLMVYQAEKDADGDDYFCDILQISSDGWVNVKNYQRKGWIKLPDPASRPEYMLSRIVSFSEYADAIEDLRRVYPEAEKAFQNKAYAKALEILSPFCEDGSLFLYDPSLELWERLFPYCRAGKLIQVIPRDYSVGFFPAKPLPFQSVKIEAPYTYHFKETMNNSTDMDFCYHIEGTDPDSGQVLFRQDFEESQNDDYRFTWKLQAEFSYKKGLIMNKPEWDKPIVRTISDLSDPQKQKRFNLRIILPGTGDYVLQNTDSGISIGGSAFDDIYERFEPLYDSQLIFGSKRAYRLIYQYDGVRRKERDS